MSWLRIIGALMIVFGGAWTLFSGVAFVYALLWGPSVSDPAGGESWGPALVLMAVGLFVLIPGIFAVRSRRTSRQASAREHVGDRGLPPSLRPVKLIAGGIVGALVGYSSALVLTTLIPIPLVGVLVKLVRLSLTAVGIVVGVRVANR